MAHGTPYLTGLEMDLAGRSVRHDGQWTLFVSCFLQCIAHPLDPLFPQVYPRADPLSTMTEPILLAQPASYDGLSTMSPAFSGSLQNIEEDLAIMRRIVEDHAQAPISDRIAISDIQSCERYLEWFNDNPSLSKNVRTLFFYGAPQNSGLELWLASPKGLQLASYLSQATDVEFCSTHFEYLYASHNPLDMISTTFFSFLPAVSTIKLHCCSFPAFEDMAALLASFRSPVKNLSLSGISWVEPSKKHAVAFYDIPSLEHLSVEAFDDMAFLSTWLMCSEIISQIRTLEIRVSDDLGTLIAARLLSVGCAKLETLLISVVMGSALTEGTLPALHCKAQSFTDESQTSSPSDSRT
jgi:hypothetical protein